MRIVHTSDWHIGKLVHGEHMTNDQRYILNQLVNALSEIKPDALVISGDIYDRAVPPTEAIKLLDEIFQKIVLDLGIKVIAIAGNHDNPDRLGFASKIMEDKGLYIVGHVEQALNPIILEDAEGEVAFLALPYFDPAILRNYFDNNNIKTHQDGLAEILSRLLPQIESVKRQIAIYHGYVRGVEELETSESERPLSLGGSEIVDVDLFKNFNYSALGHLHGPQKVKYEKVRYSGSLLKYSFSEHLHKKSVTIVDLNHAGEVKIEVKLLSPIRDMRRITGNLTDLIEYSKESNDYIEAILTDRGELIDPIGKLRSIYPNVLSIVRDRFLDLDIKQTSADKDFKKMHPTELFENFYENIMDSDLPDGGHEYVKELWKEIEIEKRQA